MTTHKVRELLDEIDEKTIRIQNGAAAWAKDEDPCAMADCDPGVQSELGSEITDLWVQIKDIAEGKP